MKRKTIIKMYKEQPSNIINCCCKNIYIIVLHLFSLYSKKCNLKDVNYNKNSQTPHSHSRVIKRQIDNYKMLTFMLRSKIIIANFLCKSKLMCINIDF